MDIFFLSLIGFLSTYLIIKITLPIFKKFLLDLPKIRSSHIYPTPRGGGAVFVLTSIILLSMSNAKFMIILCLPIALIGLLDDIFNISQKSRFFVQILTSFSIVFYSKFFENTLSVDSDLLISLMIFAFVFLSVSIINFTNFVDGLDGFLITAMIPVFLTSSILVSPNFLILVGCLAGFLIYNWSPAKLFMGDVGSTYLGAVYVLTIFSANNLHDSIGLYLITAPIQFDCISCLLRRLKNSKNIFLPHKNHLYQRLNQSGWTHKQVSYLYSSTITLLSLGFLLFGIVSFFFSIPILIIISILLERNFVKKISNY